MMTEPMSLLERLTEPNDMEDRAAWNEDGVVRLTGFFSDADLAPYRAEWLRENQERHQRPEGWPYCTPYMHHGALRTLLTDSGLALQLMNLVGEPMGVHLNLTGWVTTERDWHQDTYLNPPHVGDYYAAVWIALGRIHPASGPFQYVPGSHLWPTVTRARIIAALGYRSVEVAPPTWPKESEKLLTEMFEAEIARRAAVVETYLPAVGDVLIWHGRLLHRGSVARIRGLARPALIAHYSGIDHRQDMPPAERSPAGGWLFPIHEAVPVR